LIRRGNGLGGCTGAINDRDLFAHLPPPIGSPAIDREAPGHPDEPGAKCAAIAQAREAAVSLDEGLLRDFLGILALADDAIGDSDDSRSRSSNSRSRSAFSVTRLPDKASCINWLQDGAGAPGVQ
jgi:hypothetical protein